MPSKLTPEGSGILPVSNAPEVSKAIAGMLTLRSLTFAPGLQTTCMAGRLSLNCGLGNVRMLMSKLSAPPLREATEKRAPLMRLTLAPAGRVPERDKVESVSMLPETVAARAPFTFRLRLA